jgi:hypothetical protein
MPKASERDKPCLKTVNRDQSAPDSSYCLRI